MVVPESLVVQFRQVAIERIERVEAAWAQVLTSLDDDASTLIQREVHTLKAESRVVGFTDVNMVCHKLEDLLEVARARGYAIDEDFDLAVNMALRFMAMLVRKKVTNHPNAIDLPGFVRQIDAILKRHEHTGRSRPGSVPPLLRTVSSARASGALREQLGPAAVDMFIEYAVAKGPRRDRLRNSWHLLRDLVGIQRAVVSIAQLGKYQASVKSLARDLGKQLDLRFEIGTAEVTTEVFMAIDVASLHLVRNAVDHGIELPAVRQAAGKPEKGTIRLRAAIRDDAFVLVVEDDGRGIDFARVRARAIELGLLPEGQTVPQERLVDLMCHPGFSTRTEANEVSGRGVGLDAVRGSAVDLGGTLTARSEDGKGTTWTVTIPVPQIAAHGYVIRAPALRFPVVIGPGWRLLERIKEPTVVDLGVALGLAPSNSISSTVWSFTNDHLEVGFLSGERPQPVQVRRLVATPATSIAEVASLDSVEGLLIRPERIPGVLAASGAA
ncbi:MAG: Hpt domain-containing protein [Deltaproteobacteria bacterium]|nr:Hpt domain-containing protein [Deltaproteobacteria bacterium]